MPQYTAPLRDIQFVLHEVLQAEKTLQQLPIFAQQEVNRELIDQVLEEGAKFAQEIAFPINQSGDKEGCHFDSSNKNDPVTTPKGFKEAYKQYTQAGWSSLACDPEYGGQGLPQLLETPFQEMLNSSNQSWSMYPGLTVGAYECIHAHGNDVIKNWFLPHLVSGQWTGTMCLTEPHCGTDLGLLRTKAEPQGDYLGQTTYKINGTKIFISSGEHDIAENIVHLVLARLPDAPSGTKGISLFVVPKYLPKQDGSNGERNGIYCGSIEHKMGIHGNATCVMNLDGATGFLVGKAHKGLNAMFVMMNGARLWVGLQSLGLSEVAYQNSLAYAKDRLQSRSLTGVKAPEKVADPIIVHPDVRRMLLTQKAYIGGARYLAYWLAGLLDTFHHHEDENTRNQANDLVALLTPIVKAFITDNAFLTTNLAVQIFGGHGFIQEWGVEQYVRDARINMIYEGTNGIQSLDLLGRKVLQDGGKKMMMLGGLMEKMIKKFGVDEEMAEFIDPLMDIAGKIQKLTMELALKSQQNPDEVGAASVEYLRVIGHGVYTYAWVHMVSVALKALKNPALAENDKAFYQAQIQTARFYIQRLLPETASLIRTARSGSQNLMMMGVEGF